MGAGAAELSPGHVERALDARAEGDRAVLVHRRKSLACRVRARVATHSARGIAVLALCSRRPARRARDFRYASCGRRYRADGPRGAADAAPTPIRSPPGTCSARRGRSRFSPRWHRRSPIACGSATAAFFPVQRMPARRRSRPAARSARRARPGSISGSSIDHAVAADGRRYADLDTAFVYREKLVAGCTCNGRTRSGWSMHRRQRPIRPCGPATSLRPTAA